MIRRRPSSSPNPPLRESEGPGRGGLPLRLLFARSQTMLRSLVLAALLIVAPAAAVAQVSLIPAPARETSAPGAFHLSARTVISFEPGDQQARATAQVLADLLARSRGLKLAIRAPRPGDSVIHIAGGEGAGEAYRVQVAPGKISVAAAGGAGQFYGAVSVWQLATQSPGRGAVDIPSVTLDDQPRFGWRGLMLDSARHFQSPAFIKKLIDAMTAHKLNTLHWHLVDDQGWRIEIKKYPRLTEVGAWRTPATAPGAPRRSRPTRAPRPGCRSRRSCVACRSRGRCP
ncbi:family 20 glycosylhydrolase, partial [Phenylobacterium sp.]|uniref:family 20 glycosylhydrolase n=1 Tax=Phenylobacterium sp. TaxID=1871053 RepID=UPI00286D49D6